MPFINAGQIRTFYRLEGNQGLPVLVLSHSIGTDHALWDLQTPDLLPYFQILRYDSRGHGATDAPAGEYSVEQLGGDLLALVDALNIQKFAFCGLSMGGAVGQWLALHTPERVTALILANTSPRFATPELWNSRIGEARKRGMAAIAGVVMPRMFTPAFLALPNPYVSSIRSVLIGTDPTGYIGCCAALRDFDFSGSLPAIRSPTLVIVGEEDVSTPFAGNGENLARDIAGAHLVRLPAAHLSNVECPRAFVSAIFSFLRPRPTSNQSVLQAGLEARREVFGNEHVERAIAGTTPFTEEFQSLITQYAWGAVWSRPGLDRRVRRLLVLAMMACLGRWEEFRLHISTALKNGLEVCDIKETLLQTAVYAGVPAANTAFQIAQEELRKANRELVGVSTSL